MILQILEPGFGGVLTHAAELTSHLIHSGRSTAVAFSSCRADDGLNEFIRLLNNREVPSIDMRIVNRPGCWDVVAFPRLIKFCKRVQPSLIHCHSSKAGLLGRVVASWLKIPVVYSPHAYHGLQSRKTPATILSNFLEKWLGNVGYTVACSRDEREFAENALNVADHRITCIQNGVNFEQYAPANVARISELREMQGLPLDRFIVLSICRLEYQKDPVSLIRGFALAHATCPDLHLHLVGQGRLASTVQNEIKDLRIEANVTWTDFHGQPHELYKAADTYVSTSRYEGLPIVVLEALASNLPLVLTDCPGHQRFSELELNALRTIDQESPEQLADGMLQLYQQRHSLVNHCANSMDEFSRAKTLDRTVSLYDRILRANES